MGVGVSHERGAPVRTLDTLHLTQYTMHTISASGKAVEKRREREFFIDNLLVRIHLIIEMI